MILSTTDTDSLSDGIPEPKSLTIKAVRSTKVYYDRSRSRSRSPISRSRSPERHSRRHSRSRSWSLTRRRRTQPPVIITTDSRSRRRRSRSRSWSPPRAFVEYEDPLPIYEGIAFTSQSPLSVTYTVDDKSSIPSDGESHKISVAQLPFMAKILHVTIPRQELLAYLQVRSPASSQCID